jgi:hypothetical protein
MNACDKKFLLAIIADESEAKEISCGVKTCTESRLYIYDRRDPAVHLRFQSAQSSMHGQLIEIRSAAYTDCPGELLYELLAASGW